MQRAAFVEAYGTLHQRLDIFSKLPLESLDMPKLKERLKKIGTAMPQDA